MTARRAGTPGPWRCVAAGVAARRRCSSPGPPRSGRARCSAATASATPQHRRSTRRASPPTAPAARAAADLPEDQAGDGTGLLRRGSRPSSTSRPSWSPAARLVWLVRWLAALRRARRRRRRREPRPRRRRRSTCSSRAAASPASCSPTPAAQRAALAGGTPRNAVVECWHRFETAAAAAGLERQDWETSSEYTIRVLDLVDADPAAVSRLARPLPRGAVLRARAHRGRPRRGARGARRDPPHHRRPG